MRVIDVAEPTEAKRIDLFLTVGCLVLALGLRLAVILTQPDQLTVDRDVYLGTAIGIVEGRGYSVPNSSVATAYRPPIYPLCLSLLLLLASPPVAVAAVNLIAGEFTVWLTMILGGRLNLGRWKYLAAIPVAVDPILLRYSAQPMTESVCTCLAALWLVTTIATSNRSFEGFASGIVFGLLVLCRPTFWPLAGFCALRWLWVVWKSPVATRAACSMKALVSVLGTALVVGIWLGRNWAVFGIPILTTTHGGYTLLLANNPVFYEQVVRQRWGTAWTEASLNEWDREMMSQLKHDLGPNVTDVQADSWQSKQAKAYIAANPGAFAEATLHRVRSLWNTVPQAESGNGRIITVVGWYYTVVLVAAFIGACLVLRRPNRAAWFPIYALILTVQCVHLFYWTNARMRAPLTPAIALFAAATIARRPVGSEAAPKTVADS